MEKPDAQREAGNGTSRHFIKVAPPTVHAGVGNALRQAFRLEGDNRAAPFDDLLRRLG